MSVKLVSYPNGITGLSVFEDKLLRTIFRPKCEEVTEGTGDIRNARKNFV